MRWMVACAIVGAGVVGGCARSHHAQEINRLKSDIGILDQRVMRLERTGSQTGSSSWPVETAGYSSRRPAKPVADKFPPSIHDVQRALQRAGYDPGPIDGKMGSRTRRAVQDFQRAQGLEVDGVVGSQTWARLAGYLK